MRLNAAAFNSFLGAMGQRFAWRKASVCPCLNPHSGQTNPTCAYCSGKGYRWADAIVGLSGVVGRNQAKKAADFGLWDDGNMMLSIPSDSALYAMGLFDRIAALDRTESFSLNLLSGVNTPLRFAIVSVASVTWLDSNQALVMGDLPLIDANGGLVWIGNVPPPGVTFALTGRRAPEYYCYQDLPLDRPHHAGEPLPRRVVMRRFDLLAL